ncbi:phospholipid phosphatase-related protein type 5 [Parus major]|uniref:phospholipid phosphatase-related protein type 5 n=1 Tax=Parus major TaxID=9157 RepID=UPI001443CB9F|nr:phospholipid phosphatase-related protein type 5 [Parus major]
MCRSVGVGSVPGVCAAMGAGALLPALPGSAFPPRASSRCKNMAVEFLSSLPTAGQGDPCALQAEGNGPRLGLWGQAREVVALPGTQSDTKAHVRLKLWSPGSQTGVLLWESDAPFLSLFFSSPKIIVGETAVFCLQLATKDFENQEKTILTGDCCYINPLVRRTIRFLGIYAFGLFATDIFVNAGQVVTGNLAPHFLALCKPNYTALGCKQYTQFINGVHACTGNPDLIMKARKTFPSKEAALSIYAAMYLAMYITNTVKARGTRLAKPVLCLGLMCLAFLTGINRVAEYRNHWSDVIAGFVIGISIAVFLVVCVVNNFRGRQPEHEHSHLDNLTQMPMISIPRVESPLEKNHITAFAEVT